MSGAPSNQMLDAALEYAAQGRHIFPVHGIRDGCCTCALADCRSPGKHPHVTSWQNVASTDHVTIAQWWHQWPDANIGCACGPSGLLVLDVDPRNGGGASYARLVNVHGAIDTLTVETGGGGMHLYFRKPQGLKIAAKSLGADYPGIDVKSDGGYVILPPSVHVSGLRYTWKVRR
jgi:hypothetical protein